MTFQNLGSLVQMFLLTRMTQTSSKSQIIIRKFPVSHYLPIEHSHIGNINIPNISQVYLSRHCFSPNLRHPHSIIGCHSHGIVISISHITAFRIVIVIVKFHIVHSSPTSATAQAHTHQPKKKRKKRPVILKLRAVSWGVIQLKTPRSFESLKALPPVI